MKWVPQLYWLIANTHSGEGKIQVEHSSLSEWKRWSWESGEAKVYGMHRAEYQRGDSCTERELQRSAEISSLQLRTARHMRSYPRPRKEPPKKRELFTGTHTGLQRSFYSHQPQWKKSYHLQANGENTQKDFVSTVGQNFSLTIFQACLTKLKSTS